MGLDFQGLKDFDKELDSRGGGGIMLFQKELTEEGLDWRIFPPLPHMNGRYFIEVIKWWINGKSYISPETFGLVDPIQEEIDANSNTRDKDLKALLDNEDKLRKTSEFWIPGMKIKVIEHGKNDIEFKVIGDKPHVLSCSMMLARAINTLVTGRIASRIQSEDGITDRVDGYNLVLSKGKKGNQTTYKAELGDQGEISAEYYKKTPDVIELAKKSLNSQEYLKQVIDNYLYGDQLPDEDPKKGYLAKQSADSEEGETKSRRRSGGDEEERESSTRSNRRNKEEPKEEVETKTTSRRSRETEPAAEEKSGSSRRGGLLASLENDNDLD